MNFISRGLQLLEKYNIKINMDMFLSSFTFDTEKGEQRPADTWDLGPSFHWVFSTRSTISAGLSLLRSGPFKPIKSQFVNEEIESFKKQDQWTRYYESTVAHIPYTVTKANGVKALFVTSAYTDKYWG